MPTLTHAVVRGFGNVVKTLLARATSPPREGKYAGVCWITAADRPGTPTCLAALAHGLDPRLPPEQAVCAVLDHHATCRVGP